ncbi:MAG: hypothetical protein LBB56_08060, partial [Chitinispirillales bacterium]|nr:hypothetical protein [Chitinispirillales bacterium]
TPVKKLNEKAPDTLVHIVEKCLAADRNRRIKNSRELCALLAGCVEDTSRKAKLQSIKETQGVITAKLQDACALTEQKIKKIWAVAEPVYKRTLEKFSSLCNDKALPAINKTFYKVYNTLTARYSKSQIMTAIAAASGLTALIVIILLIGAVRGKNDDNHRLYKAARSLGYTVKSSSALADSCRALINRGDLYSANNLADVLILSKQSAVQGRLFKGMTALSSDKYNEALSWFTELQKIGGGTSAIRKERPFFISYIEKRIDREMPVVLVDLCAEALFLNEAPQIKAFVKSDHYWQRWNAARILKKAGDKVDLVELYILDLEHAVSHRTKINAAEKLGELGDKRAVPALLDARDSRGAVSHTARTVLREKFNVR